MNNKIVAGSLIAGIIFAGSVGVASADSAPPTNSPKNGHVVGLKNDDQAGSVWKWCDGPTLVYQSFWSRSGGIAVIPNSPECR